MRDILKFINSIVVMSLFFCINLYCDTAQCCTGKSISKNTFLPRSFSSSSSREILMRKPMYNEPAREAWNGILTTAIEYSSNFGCNSDKNLGTMPFWSGSNVMTVGTNDGKSDLDAYQFGMGDVATVGEIKLDPKVQQAGADLMLHFMQHLDRAGFYFKIKAPIGAMMIDPRMSLPVEVAASSAIGLWNRYPAPDYRPGTIAEAFAGGRASVDIDGAFSKPIRLEYGKITLCKTSAIRLADVSVSFGANVLKTEKGVLGIGFKVTTPTGNVPRAIHMLEPIFGRGGYWGFGGELFGHYQAWQSDEWKIFTHWQGEVLHLAHGRTSYRSFDLKQNGPGSKYLLLEYYHQNTTDGLYVPGGFVTQAINVTTLPVKSKFKIEGSFACMVDAQSDSWNFSVGAEVWARSCETLQVDCCKAVQSLETGSLNSFAVLGRQISGGAIHLCQPLAKINESEPEANAVDVAKGILDATLSQNRIPSNIETALDIQGAAAHRAITGKVLAQCGYLFKENNYQPHVGLYGSVEFTGSDNNALNMWAFGVQGSLNF